ncbi:MAG: tRNA (adenosine(37)-N6)-threonylcarbamoyltransferase complex ATPase subunit type 1 TsaE [Boseongicola sp.]
MPAADIVEIDLPTADDTAACALQLAPRLGAGDCILLEGSLGAVKTHFARTLIQRRLAEFGKIEDVPSPTYTLVQTYHAGPLEILHADLYRLGSADELIELGLDEAFGSALILIEWPDRLGDMAPTDALCLRFEFREHGRVLRASGPDRLLQYIRAFDG